GAGGPRPPNRAGAREGAGDRRAGRHVRGREGGHEGVQGEAEAGLQGPLNVLVHLAVLQELVAGHIPERQALVWRDQILTYAELLGRSRRVGRALCRLGLGCRVERAALQPWESGHDHVAIYAYNGSRWLESMFGTLHARAAFVNVNYRYVADELRFVLATSRARAIIYHAAFAPRLAAVPGSGPPSPRSTAAGRSSSPTRCGASTATARGGRSCANASTSSRSAAMPSPSRYSPRSARAGTTPHPSAPSPARPRCSRRASSARWRRSSRPARSSSRASAPRRRASRRSAGTRPP